MNATATDNLLDAAPDAPQPTTLSRVPAGNGLAPAALAAEPTFESMMMHAVNQGASPTDLKEMFGMWRDYRAEKAAEAFNAAMAAFRAECPAIVKSRDALKGNQVMYRYADLSEITKVVDPILYRHGLTYTWDTKLDGDQTVIVCTVHHVKGHSRSSTFTCKGSGTSMMNAAQVAASATTFGRRYSLVFALGLTVDDDDDGRRAVAPNPAPEPDPTAPQHRGRADGYAPVPPPAPPADPNRVTAADLNALLGEWRTRAEKPNGTPAEFANWAGGVLARNPDSLGRPSGWTVDDVATCRNVML